MTETVEWLWRAFAKLCGWCWRAGKWVRRAGSVARPVVGGFGYRYRIQLRPVVVLFVLVLARWGVSHTPPLSAFALSALGCGAVLFRCRAALDRAAEWVFAVSCVTAVTGGLVAVSVMGTDAQWLNVASAFGWVAGSMVWWVHHSGPDIEPLEPGAIVQRWDKYIRRGTGPMKKAILTGPVPFAHGDTYSVDLVPYVQTLSKAQSDMPNWVTALDVAMEDMILERHPDHPTSQRLLRLQIITTSPIKETVFFDQPRVEDGRIMLGPYADGIGEAFLRLYTDNSMHSTFILGGTGSGKTRALEQIAISALSMRDTIIFYMDGQNGASSPTLWRYADWAVGCDGVVGMLSALERCAKWRQMENTALGHEGFTPSPGRSGILVVIDEQHRVAPLAPERFANAANEWRKIGQAFLGADQDSGLDAAFAGKDRLRSGMCSGNAFAMRVASRIAGNLLPGLDINPVDLPRLPGYAVAVAAEGSGGRTAGFRNRYSPNAAEKAKLVARGEVVDVPTITEWFERLPNPAMDAGAARALGPDYTERHVRAAEQREALLRIVNGESGDLSAVGLETTGVMDAELEATEKAGRVTCAQRILGLDWSTDLEFAGVRDRLPEVKLTTIRKALDKLVVDGELARDPDGKVYRRVKVTV